MRVGPNPIRLAFLETGEVWTQTFRKIIEETYGENGASLGAQLVKNPPALQEILVQFLGQEDYLENG